MNNNQKRDQADAAKTAGNARATARNKSDSRVEDPYEKPTAGQDRRVEDPYQKTSTGKQDPRVEDPFEKPTAGADAAPDPGPRH